MQLAPSLFNDVESLHLEAVLQQMVRKRLSHQSHADDTHAIAQLCFSFWLEIYRSGMMPHLLLAAWVRMMG
jgi:hypothetical protein